MRNVDRAMRHLKEKLEGKKEVTSQELVQIMRAYTAHPYWIEQYIKTAIARGIIKLKVRGSVTIYEVQT